MKLCDLISRYQDLCHMLSQVEGAEQHQTEPLELAADRILVEICQTCPQDGNDVVAMAMLAQYMIEIEEDPYEAIVLLNHIATWAATLDMDDGPVVRH